MQGVPAGREGTSPTYAFKTVNAAAQRAEQLVKTSPVMPGPYMQTLIYTSGSEQNESTVVRANINNPVFTQARNLIQQNRTFIQKETIAWIKFTYPDFAYNVDYCERDIGLILDAISFDINRGATANFLTRQAAERYYSSVSGRRAVTVQQTETIAAIDFAAELTEFILENTRLQAQNISDITKDKPALVTTEGQHNWKNGNLVYFENVGGMVDIEGAYAYVKVV